MLNAVVQTMPLNKQEYKKEEQELRTQLLELQRRIAAQNKPVMIVIAGDDRSGRHESINALCKWMDPRFISVNAYGPSQYEDESRPFFWRFWRDSPGHGEIAIYLRDWTSVSIVQYLNDEITEKKLQKRISYIRNFEKKHIDAGTAVIKFWLHISEPVLKERLSQKRNTPYFDEKDKLALHNYEHAIETISHTLSATNTEKSQWHIISGDDPQQRNLLIGKQISERLNAWLTENESHTPKPEKNILTLSTHNKKALPKSINVTFKSNFKDDKARKKANKAELKELQGELHQLMFELHTNGIPVVAVFEGWDAAGKGGAIRRLVAPLDAGFYRIKPIAKPTEEEYSHHYLWRFWRNIPRNGYMTIFDRSWYGRVLVERVEGFAKPHEWQLAYQEINDFEEQLTIHGSVVLKFWLNISNEEQLRRFKEREITAHKQFKITDEDYRNREKWDEYVDAVEDMVALTSTKRAPWHMISTDNKDEARVKVLKIAVETLQKKLKRL